MTPLGSFDVFDISGLTMLIADPFTAVPHRLTSDDVYNGYHLPSGSIVVGNAW